MDIDTIKIQCTDVILHCLCRFAGILSIAELGLAMQAGADLQKVAPHSRWDVNMAHSPANSPKGSAAVASRFATYVDSTYAFDAEAFRLGGNEAMLMDPQQRLLLEEVASAVADSGNSIDALQGAPVGERMSGLSFCFPLHALGARSRGGQEHASP